MKWPDLVPPSVCNTKIKIVWEDGIDEDGAPAVKTIYDGRCNYSEKSMDVLDAERRLIRLEAVALLHGDPVPNSDIAGTAVIGGGTVRRKIFRSYRARNPDGSVNFTKLELM